MVLPFILGVGVGIFIGQEYKVPKIKVYCKNIYNEIKNYEKNNDDKNNDK